MSEPQPLHISLLSWKYNSLNSNATWRSMNQWFQYLIQPQCTNILVWFASESGKHWTVLLDWWNGCCDQMQENHNGIFSHLHWNIQLPNETYIVQDDKAIAYIGYINAMIHSWNTLSETRNFCPLSWLSHDFKFCYLIPSYKSTLTT